MPNYFLDYIKTIFFIRSFTLCDDEPPSDFKAAAKKIAGPYSLEHWDSPKFAKFTSKTCFRITNKRLKQGYVRLKHINGWSHIEIHRVERADGKVCSNLSFFTSKSDTPFCQLTLHDNVDDILGSYLAGGVSKCALTQKHIDVEVITYGRFNRGAVLGLHNRLWFIGSVYNAMQDSLARVFIMFAECLPLPGALASAAQLLVAERIPGCYACHFNAMNKKIVVNVMDQGIFFAKLKTGGQYKYTLYIDGTMYGHFCMATGDVREWEQVDSVTLQDCPFGQLVLHFRTKTFSDVPLFHVSVLGDDRVASELDGFYYSSDCRSVLVNHDKPRVRSHFNEMDEKHSDFFACSISFAYNGNMFRVDLPCENGFKSLSTLTMGAISDQKRTVLLQTVHSADGTGSFCHVFIRSVNALWGIPNIRKLAEIEQSLISDSMTGRRSFECALKMMWMEICSTLIHGKKWYDHIEILRTRNLESIARHGCRFDPSAFVLDLLQTPEYRAKFQRWTTEFIVWEMLNYPVKWQFYASSKHVPEVDEGVSDRDEYKSDDDDAGSGAAAAAVSQVDLVVLSDDDDAPPAAGGGGKRRRF